MLKFRKGFTPLNCIDYEIINVLRSFKFPVFSIGLSTSSIKYQKDPSKFLFHSNLLQPLSRVTQTQYLKLIDVCIPLKNIPIFFQIPYFLTSPHSDSLVF